MLQSLIAAEGEAKKELALAFHARGLLSAGKAAEMAEVERRVFEGWLAERAVERPWSEGEVARDLACAEQGEG